MIKYLVRRRFNLIDLEVILVFNGLIISGNYIYAAITILIGAAISAGLERMAAKTNMPDGRNGRSGEWRVER